MISVFYDLTQALLVDGAARERSEQALRIAYQGTPVWRIAFVIANPGTGTNEAQDVSDAVAWGSAIKVGFDHSEEPMTRTLNTNIDSSAAADGLIDVTIDANTATFLSAVQGQSFIKTPNFELRGLGAGGEVLYYAKFGVIADNCLDPAGGTPPAPTGNYYTKTEADALLAADRPSVTLDPTSTGDTNVFTVPAGYFFIPTRAFDQCLTITADGAGHTGKWKADAVDLTDAELTGQAAANDVDSISLAADKAWPAGTVFAFEVTVASTHSIHTARLALTGALYSA